MRLKTEKINQKEEKPTSPSPPGAITMQSLSPLYTSPSPPTPQP